METVWKLQDAKSQFSKVVQNALKSGPQYVTRRGTKAVVVLSVSDYEKLISNKLSFKDFLHCRMSAFGHFLRCLSMLSVSRPSVFSPVDKGIAATEMTPCARRKFLSTPAYAGRSWAFSAILPSGKRVR
jgi:prevent-host-death family protein